MNFQAFDLPQLRARQSRKWRSYPEDVIPAWIADMDFPIAAAIQHELERIVATNDYGYPGRPPKDDPVFDIFAERALARFGWVVDPWRMECLVDVVQGIYLALQLYSEPGDGVVILTPSYPPFLHAAKDTGRTAVCHTLSVGAEGEYEIDFERLANTIDARTRILLLCSPHNPTGRVWRRAELEALADLALRHDLIVLADEIHADLVYPGNRHMPFATLGPEIESRTITFTSATKAFNIAGLRFAVAIFGSAALQERFNSVPSHVRGGVNTPGLIATRVAWQSGQEWLDQALLYLRQNRDFIADTLGSKANSIDYRAPQATYLAWLDCRALQLPREPYEYFLEHAKVAFSDGRTFGAGGAGCVRLNFATPRPLLQELLTRLAGAL